MRDSVWHGCVGGREGCLMGALMTRGCVVNVDFGMQRGVIECS